uniref:Uncharacterized protein n=1 Tax=Ditylenchus dipsaci TaxID=166011 RepID=A0A915ES08_9BILA
MEVYLDWIVRAWDALPNNQVINSFKVCGLTNAGDGSEDDFIHCFKAHVPIPEGFEMLKEARAMETAAEHNRRASLQVAGGRVNHYMYCYPSSIPLPRISQLVEVIRGG